jgi:hypothetical protein
MSQILNLDEAPNDPIQRIIWLDGVMAAVRKELNHALEDAYFEARVQGVFATALEHGAASQKRAVAWTRHGNEARGRVVKRWNDGY